MNVLLYFRLMLGIQSKESDWFKVLIRKSSIRRKLNKLRLNVFNYSTDVLAKSCIVKCYIFPQLSNLVHSISETQHRSQHFVNKYWPPKLLLS